MRDVKDGIFKSNYGLPLWDIPFMHNTVSLTFKLYLLTALWKIQTSVLPLLPQKIVVKFFLWRMTQRWIRLGQWKWSPLFAGDRSNYAIVSSATQFWLALRSFALTKDSGCHCCRHHHRPCRHSMYFFGTCFDLAISVSKVIVQIRDSWKLKVK